MSRWTLVFGQDMQESVPVGFPRHELLGGESVDELGGGEEEHVLLDWSAEAEEEEQDLQWDLTGDADCEALVDVQMYINHVESLPGAIIFCPVYILSCVLCNLDIVKIIDRTADRSRQ